MTRTSYTLVVVAAFIVGAFGSLVLWQSFGVSFWPGNLFGMVSIAACLGMLARRSWSRFLVYLLVSFVSIFWLAKVVEAVNEGAWERYNAVQVFLSLVPGLGLILVALGCAFVAGRFLRPSSTPV